MLSKLFYRNVRAAEHLQLFLVSAASTVLIQRFFLYLTHYPQVGGNTLHIAHMLYGGLLMMAAIVLMVSFLGERIRHISSCIGGIGFGLFIDELGKFITKDNDYFFRPTIGLIYAVFVIIFLLFNYLGRQRSLLSDSEYELNALNQLEEAVLQDLDPGEKQRIVGLLNQIKTPSPIAIALQKLLASVPTVHPPEPGFIKRTQLHITNLYARFWQHEGAKQLISIIFVAQAVLLLATVAYALFTSFNSAVGLNGSNDAYANRLLVAEFISSAIAGLFAFVGAVRLFSSRERAYDLFRTSLLINIFLSEFFLFSRIQFGALPSFAVNLLLLIALRFAQYQEQQIHKSHGKL